MKTAKELELSLLLKESHIQQLNLKLNDLENRIDKAIKLLESVWGVHIQAQELLIKILKGEDNER